MTKRDEMSIHNCAVCNKRKNVSFEILTAVTMKTTTFRDVTLCSLVDVNRRFGGMYYVHLQESRAERWYTYRILRRVTFQKTELKLENIEAITT
jgi:hypothetical protein